MTRSELSAGDAAAVEAARGDAGAGLFGLVGAITVFLGLLLVATHLLFHLYARSVVTSTAEAAVRHATRYSDGASCAAMAGEAESRALADLGRAASYAEASAECSGGVLRLHLVVRPPSALPRFASGLGFDTIDRTVEIRIEELQP